LANLSDFFRVGLSWSPIHGLEHRPFHVPEASRRLVEVRARPLMGSPISGSHPGISPVTQAISPLPTAVQSGLAKVFKTGGWESLGGEIVCHWG